MASKAKLLVVDDELIVRDSLNKWFREEGHDVTVADSAQEASTKMAAERFDLALVDIKMPGVDGVELQKRMHEIDPDMIVIIMTGYASVETAVAALKNGAYDYVSKPFDPDDMAHTVQNALAHKRAERENERLRETVASVVRPQEMITVFAGADIEATDRARSYFTGYPPSSPSIALLRNGELVFFLQCHDIENRDAEDIAAELTAAFDKFCTTAAAAR